MKLPKNNSYEFWKVYELSDTIEELRKLHRKYKMKYNE